MFYRKYWEGLWTFEKVQNKEKSEKCEINCRPSVLRSPTVLCIVHYFHKIPLPSSQESRRHWSWYILCLPRYLLAYVGSTLPTSTYHFHPASGISQNIPLAINGGYSYRFWQKSSFYRVLFYNLRVQIYITAWFKATSRNKASSFYPLFWESSSRPVSLLNSEAFFTRLGFPK